MKLPDVVSELINAQNSHDSLTYANCFSENAVVSDEGETHQGRKKIQQWIDAANKKYQTMMQPVNYTEAGTSGMLSANISGTFPGSPALLHYHFEIIDGLIQSLKVTG